jgi:hypothetical protein
MARAAHPADELAALDQRRQALLRQLVTPAIDPVDQVAAIGDPADRAVAATRALAIGNQLRAIRNHTAHQLARPGPSDAPGLSGAAIGRLLGITRQAVDQLLDRDQPALPSDPASPVVAAVLRLGDPVLRAQAVRLALGDHQRRRPALLELQRTAAREAVIGGQVTQAELGRRLGRHRSWFAATVGRPASTVLPALPDDQGAH